MLRSQAQFRLAVAAMLALSAALALAPSAEGQVRGSVEAFIGYYHPFGHFDPGSVIVAGELPAEPSDLSATTWGGVGHLSVGRRFGVRGQLAATIHSRVPETITPGGPRGPTDAAITVATVQGEYDVSPAPERYRIWLDAGPGLIRHGGDAYRQYGSPTSLAGTFGITLAVPVTSQLHVVANATGVLYGFRLPTPTDLRQGSLEHGNQRDGMVHVGVAWGRL